MAIGRYGMAEQRRRRMEWEEADSRVEWIHAMSGVWDYEYTDMRLWLVSVRFGLEHCTAFWKRTPHLYD